MRHFIKHPEHAAQPGVCVCSGVFIPLKVTFPLGNPGNFPIIQKMHLSPLSVLVPGSHHHTHLFINCMYIAWLCRRVRCLLSLFTSYICVMLSVKRWKFPQVVVRVQCNRRKVCCESLDISCDSALCFGKESRDPREFNVIGKWRTDDQTCMAEHRAQTSSI